MKTQSEIHESTVIFGLAVGGLIVLLIARALLGPGM